MIRDYLRETRLFSRQMPGHFVEAHYIPIIVACETFCSALLHTTKTAPRIGITYSAQRKCELVELGGTRTLIYDQNLGQTLNSFNRIVFFGEKSVSAYRPLLRMLTDEAILIGRIDLATFLLAKTLKYNDSWDLPPAATEPFVQTQTWLQEAFIIAHEYCHLLMAADESFRAQRARVGRLIWEPVDDPSPVEIREGLLKRYGEAPTVEQIAERFSFVRDNVKSSENDLAEELGCDDFAFHALVSYGNSVFLPPEDFFKATFLVLRHIRAINYARAFIRQLDEGADPSGVDRRVKLLQARQHQLRNVFPTMLAAIKSGSARDELQKITAEMLHEQISELSDLHDKKIDEVLLFELFPNLREEFLAWKRRYKRSEQYDIAQCRQLALARGWTIGRDDIPYVSFPKQNS